MKKNLKFIFFIIFAILVLYLSKINYGEYSLQKSISACILAQLKKSNEMTKELAKKYCEE